MNNIVMVNRIMDTIEEYRKGAVEHREEMHKRIITYSKAYEVGIITASEMAEEITSCERKMELDTTKIDACIYFELKLDELCKELEN